MGKYRPLETFLSKQSADSCTLTFPEIEKIIGGSLPASARNLEQWWGNDRSHTQACSWMRAGWIVESPGSAPIKKRVRFVRTARGGPSSEDSFEDRGTSQVIVRNLATRVVAELKRRAKRNGHSLERELRMILTRAARPERSELIAEADRIRAMTPDPLEDSVSLLREDRERP